jgi:GR25 family glycosyltransferase involved in LPS biosynthesis
MSETIDLTVNGQHPLFFLINLDSATNRWEHFLGQIKQLKSPIYVKRFSAIHGDSHVFTEEENRLCANLDCRTQRYANRIKGNQLSHYYILKEIIKFQVPYAIVCQDDVMFCDDFTEKLTNVLKSIPKDAEMINIGFHKEACYSYFVPWDFNDAGSSFRHLKSRVNDYVGVLKDSENPCSLSYIVTLQGAINMVKYFDEVGFLRATDHNFNVYLVQKNIFYASIPVLCTGTTIFGSSIFLEE